uniref:Uncharacterized protein n=1 Tax=Trypanosoma congolense (strain IL3000) TaxID=1068625 RepID=G0UXT1_TRYCI|nr:conserved hypothetical protein [Trypanosoma congolense IL3000]
MDDGRDIDEESCCEDCLSGTERSSRDDRATWYKSLTTCPSGKDTVDTGNNVSGVPISLAPRRTSTAFPHSLTPYTLDRVSGPTASIHMEDTSSDCLSSDDFRRSLGRNVGRPGLPSLTKQLAVHEHVGDPKTARKHLLNAFPESLRHIAVDEVADANASPTTGAIGADSGYHRQFTEQTLMEIYSLLCHTASAVESRKQYLLTESPVGVALENKTTERIMEIECAQELTAWGDAWYRPYLSTKSGVLASVTAQPPQFKAGMLWDGSNRVLLGGTAFTEEARILPLKVSHSLNCSGGWSPSLPLLVEMGGSPMYQGVENPSPYDAGSSGPKKTVHLLLREYASLSKVRAGCIIQTFSLVSENVQLQSQRSYFLPHNQIQKVLDKCTAGAVTRAFSLQLLLSSGIQTDQNTPILPNSSSGRGTDSLSCGDRVDSLTSEHESMFNTIRSDFLMSTNTMMTSRVVKVPTKTRQPLGDEVYLRFTNPRLYFHVMQHSPAVLTAHTNAIREYMFYSRRLQVRRRIIIVMRSVRTLQKFFRKCLDRKKRAMKSMLRHWRKLEHQCRARLKRQTFQSASTNRISFIVGSVLWDHVVTTEDYKLKMLEELMAARRVGYLQWCSQRREENKIILEMRRTAGSTPAQQDMRSFGVDAVQPPSSSYALPGISNDKSHHKWIERWMDIVHARFGWYIDPEELLQESHRRILHSLRGSILAMADVQAELKKRGGGDDLPLL